ncbi:MAG: cysteine--tRNA ligase [Bauldia sp.]|uniref:cysteine--tRNA ligase n=1 Tax=Bauldia sp. TaxID=2575872 RepID=UPI001DA1A246|nr:cysteine--tRNA ligase [Bauldia sp.]MCB1494458.1 cysteine--tRNA ligase [Bauldia sp.]
MGLRLYNTLTRTKEVFDPIDPRNVRMYVCGPTVYDFAHIGNARPLIVFDVLFRLLRHTYGADHVTYVRNITDVDDKINARAAEDFSGLPLNEAIRKLTTRTEEQFHADVDALGCLRPTVEPRATDHIAEMRSMIDELVEKGFAYVAEDHVLFDVARMPDYGKLSNRSLDDMIAGARVEVAPYKKNATDFVLWKPSKPGEPAWPSPAGIATPGRPGWHLECSAMSDKWLWEKAKPNLSEKGLAHPHEFDIHGGGIDLVFPHHENEIAQSRCAHGTAVMANYWMHNGFLQVEGEKMSKSLGNFVTIRELLETERFGGRSWSGEVLRLAMLRTHYRQPIDWTVAALEEAQKHYVGFGNVVREHMASAAVDDTVLTALSDDLNTPAAFSELFRLRDMAISGDQSAGQALTGSLRILGLFEKKFSVRLDLLIPQNGDVDAFVAGVAKLTGDFDLRDISGQLDRSVHPNFVHVLAKFVPGTTVRDIRSLDGTALDWLRADEARAAARAEKNWAEADRIRDELDAMGIALKDAKDPETGELVTTWEVKR